ncbi:hypothetical protein ANCCEY_13820, partial [Ancylostoma ceylanicum]
IRRRHRLGAMGRRDRKSTRQQQAYLLVDSQDMVPCLQRYPSKYSCLPRVKQNCPEGYKCVPSTQEGMHICCASKPPRVARVPPEQAVCPGRRNGGGPHSGLHAIRSHVPETSMFRVPYPGI